VVAVFVHILPLCWALDSFDAILGYTSIPLHEGTLQTSSFVAEGPAADEIKVRTPWMPSFFRNRISTLARPSGIE
jgi:hypothetical protein